MTSMLLLNFLRIPRLSWIAVLAIAACTPILGADDVLKENTLKSSAPVNIPAIPAFPGAEGHGATSVGGRGGRVIEVTNLNDSGVGSLRDALEAEGARIVVFRVAGIIELHRKIQIKNPYLTVAGQTAPGGGITLKGKRSSLLGIHAEAHDIVIRYLRLRNGSGKANGSGNDNLTINGGYNIVIDHVSMSWSTDENASIFRREKMPPIFNLTIQRSMMTEGLAGHSNGLIVTGKAHRNWLGQRIDDWKQIYNLSIHHNLFAHNTHRNPRVTSAGAQVVNNVIYNWKFRIGEVTRGSVIDLSNNYAKVGPMFEQDLFFTYERDSIDRMKQQPDVMPSIYTVGNLIDPKFTDANTDNWRLWRLPHSTATLPEGYRRRSPLAKAVMPVRETSAQAAYQAVLSDVGANARLDCLGRWVPNADAVDRRILNDVKNQTGPRQPIRSPDEVGGYPTIEAGQPCADLDRDGMPDVWESRYNLNPNHAVDRSSDADNDGYTNLEEYLNGTPAR